MHQRQRFTTAEIAAVDVQSTDRAGVPALMPYVGNQVLDCMDAGLQRVKHDLPGNAGDTEHDKRGDQKKHCVSVHQNLPRANVWVKSLIMENTNRNNDIATRIARSHGNNSARFCGGVVEMPKNVSRSENREAMKSPHSTKFFSRENTPNTNKRTTPISAKVSPVVYSSKGFWNGSASSAVSAVACWAISASWAEMPESWAV